MIVVFCRRFEERNKELESQYIELREDKADVVAFLKRTLQQRTDTIHVTQYTISQSVELVGGW